MAWYEDWLDERAAGRVRRHDFDRPGWDAATVRDHPDTDPAVRLEAVRAVASLGDTWSRERLVTVATSDADAGVRMLAARRLLHYGASPAAPLTLLLQDEDPAIRYETWFMGNARLTDRGRLTDAHDRETARARQPG